MSNPGGMNQFQRESPYGAVKKMTRLTREAPISGAPTPGANAPQRAQRRAVRGRQPAAPPPQPQQAQPPQLSDDAVRAEVWRQISAYTEDPLVQEYAARASRF